MGVYTYCKGLFSGMRAGVTLVDGWDEFSCAGFDLGES
jgi:hypothetical protein